MIALRTVGVKIRANRSIHRSKSMKLNTVMLAVLSLCLLLRASNIWLLAGVTDISINNIEAHIRDYQVPKPEEVCNATRVIKLIKLKTNFQLYFQYTHWFAICEPLAKFWCFINFKCVFCLKEVIIRDYKNYFWS